MICDFDGTLAFLELDWADLRRRCAVERISQLWDRGPAAWEPVTAAEIAAAAVARPHLGSMALVAGRPIVIVSANSALAIERFLERGWPLDVRDVIGRERLGGPKFDPDVFAAAIGRARAVLGEVPDYLGDAPEELSLARAHGLVPIDATTIDPAPAPGPGASSGESSSSGRKPQVDVAAAD